MSLQHDVQTTVRHWDLNSLVSDTAERDIFMVFLALESMDLWYSKV